MADHATGVVAAAAAAVDVEVKRPSVQIAKNSAGRITPPVTFLKD